MNVEEEVKALQKYMGTMVKLVKELKTKIEVLENKQEAHQCEKVEDILNKQKAVGKKKKSSNKFRKHEKCGNRNG